MLQKDTPKRSLPYSPTSQIGPREAQEPERPRPDATVIDDIDRLLTMFDNPEHNDGGQDIDFDALAWSPVPEAGVT